MRVTFKSPDAVFETLADIIDEDEREKAKKVIDRFVKYSEYITVDFNLDTGEATVVPVR